MKKFLLILFVIIIFAMPVLAETVIYNTKTGKYHKPSCRWAQKCTVNCIKIEKQKAKIKGGIPCKTCGG